MKTYLKNRKHFLWALYLCFYMPWFMWLEDTVTHDFYDVTIPFDHTIPFCEYFVIPYYAWFFFIAFSWVYLALADKEDFYKFIATLYTGMTAFLIISTLFPNGQTLRIPVDPDENFCTWLVYQLRLKDTPTNVFPSLHVYNSLVCCFALCKCKRLQGYRILRVFVIVLTCLICLSTVFIKQHSVIDGCGAVILFLMVYPICYIWIPRYQTQKKVQSCMDCH